MRRGSVSRNLILKALAVLGCLTAFFFAVLPIVTTQPSKAAVRHWAAGYSPLLPPGYTDFEGHWQSQDVGVRIFSFRCPEGWTGERVLRHLTEHISKFKIHDQRPGEVALRRPVAYSDPAGFDEFRFVYQEKNDRIYGMFANLDSEMDVQGELVKQLHDIAQNAKQRKE
jgi:hypothetical protein